MRSILKAANMFCSNREEADDWSTIAVEIMPALQRVVETTGNAGPRKSAFSVLKGVIKKGLPQHVRFKVLRALISSSSHPSVGLLWFNCLEHQIETAWPSIVGEKPGTISFFVESDLVDVLEDMLERTRRYFLQTHAHGDFVLRAVNSYMFLLLLEIQGGTNYTGIRRRAHLMKVRERWLWPLEEESLDP